PAPGAAPARAPLSGRESGLHPAGRPRASVDDPPGAAPGRVRPLVTLTLDRHISQFPGDIYFYGNASHGFKDVLTWLQAHHRRRRPNVLMPGFIPAKLYRTLLAAGYDVRFYDIGPTGDFDHSEIAELTDADTLAIFVIHYFGLPADLAQVREFSTR